MKRLFPWCDYVPVLVNRCLLSLYLRIVECCVVSVFEIIGSRAIITWLQPSPAATQEQFQTGIDERSYDLVGGLLGRHKKLVSKHGMSINHKENAARSEIDNDCSVGELSELCATRNRNSSVNSSVVIERH